MGMLENFNRKKVFIPAHDRSFTPAASRPRYPKKENGVCLVVGTHPCVDQDLDEAMAKHPGAKFCAVNEATAIVPAHHLATYHGAKIEQFIQKHEDAWGLDAYELPIIHMSDIPEAVTDRPCYRWNMNYGGGSGIFAAAAMVAIGFDLVIFCGCPMDGGGGYAIQDTHKSTPDDPRLGDLDKSHSMVVAWHMAIEQLKETRPEIASKIRSMSGFTQTIFGGIE